MNINSLSWGYKYYSTVQRIVALSEKYTILLLYTPSSN
jgi:hypothetical protein